MRGLTFGHASAQCPKETKKEQVWWVKEKTVDYITEAKNHKDTISSRTVSKTNAIMSGNRFAELVDSEQLLEDDNEEKTIVKEEME